MLFYKKGYYVCIFRGLYFAEICASLLTKVRFCGILYAPVRDDLRESGFIFLRVGIFFDRMPWASAVCERGMSDENTDSFV